MLRQLGNVFYKSAAATMSRTSLQASAPRISFARRSFFSLTDQPMTSTDSERMRICKSITDVAVCKPEPEPEPEPETNFKYVCAHKLDQLINVKVKPGTELMDNTGPLLSERFHLGLNTNHLVKPENRAIEARIDLCPAPYHFNFHALYACLYEPKSFKHVEAQETRMRARFWKKYNEDATKGISDLNPTIVEGMHNIWRSTKLKKGGDIKESNKKFWRYQSVYHSRWSNHQQIPDFYNTSYDLGSSIISKLHTLPKIGYHWGNFYSGKEFVQAVSDIFEGKINLYVQIDEITKIPYGAAIGVVHMREREGDDTSPWKVINHPRYDEISDGEFYLLA